MDRDKVENVLRKAEQLRAARKLQELLKHLTANARALRALDRTHGELYTRLYNVGNCFSDVQRVWLSR